MYGKISRLLKQARQQSLYLRTYSNIYMMNFSTIKSTENLYETAKIAYQVIKMIRNPFQKSELEKEAGSDLFEVNRNNSYALAERIESALTKLDQYPESRNKILQLFTKGVIVPPKLFHQARISEARTDQRFVYCPNSIVSKQIFEILSENPPFYIMKKNRFLLKGYRGISKTVSVSLLWHLTKLIDEYRFSQLQSQQTQIKEFKSPIIVYWSIKRGDLEESVWEQLLKQLPGWEKVFTIQDLMEKNINIGQKYFDKFGIKVILVVDQINSLAKLDRLIQAQKQKNQKLDQNDQKKFKKIQTLMQLVSLISQRFSKTIYLSSMDIEYQFLKKSDLAANIGHTNVAVQQVQYANLIYNHQILPQICHFFMFEFQQKVFQPKNIKISSQNLRDAQQECTKYLKQRLQKRDYFFATFYNIFQMVKDYQTFDFNEQNVTDLKKFLIQKFKSFIQVSTQYTKTQFSDHFLKKDSLDSVRKVTALMLSQQIQAIIKKEYLYAQRDLKSTFSQPHYKINIKDLLLDKDEAKNVLPQTFFSLPDYNNMIKLRLPAKLTYQILEPKISLWLKFYLKNIGFWISKSLMMSGIAGSIQRLFVLALKKGNTSITINMKMNSKKNPEPVKRHFHNIKKGSYPFQPIDPSNKNQSFLQRIKIPLQRMFTQLEDCAVFEPVLKKIYSKDQIMNNLKDVKPHMHNEVSKGVDLILAKRIKPDIKEAQINISLDLIDITVENTENTLWEKMSFFLQTFLHFTDRHSTEIQLFKGSDQRKLIPISLRYLIFCQKNNSKNLLTDLRNSTLGQKLNFKGSEEDNDFLISFKDGKSSLLVQVGFINIGQDVILEDKKGEINFLAFQQALKVFNQRKRRKKEDEILQD